MIEVKNGSDLPPDVKIIEKPLTRTEVVSLMQSSSSEQDWSTNCDLVKSMSGGRYPEFWYQAILVSGVGQDVFARFNR